MPRSKVERSSGPTRRFTGGNGSPRVETDAERLARLEELILKIQQSLDVQFHRIAELQLQLDRATVSQPLPKL